MDKNISTLLREVKGATGFSQVRLAAELGTSQPTVNRILRGQADCKGSTQSAIISLHGLHCGVTVARRTSKSRRTRSPPKVPD